MKEHVKDSAPPLVAERPLPRLRGRAGEGARPQAPSKRLGPLSDPPPQAGEGERCGQWKVLAPSRGCAQADCRAASMAGRAGGGRLVQSSHPSQSQAFAGSGIRTAASASLLSCGLHLVVGENKVVTGLRLVAIEADVQVDLGIRCA